MYAYVQHPFQWCRNANTNACIIIISKQHAECQRADTRYSNNIRSFNIHCVDFTIWATTTFDLQIFQLQYNHVYKTFTALMR